MARYPTLLTERLVLREFDLGDAHELRSIAQSKEVARSMLRHPHPYEEGMAEEWIAGLRPAFEAGTRETFAVTLREGGALVGTVSLFFGEREGEGLLAFWVGVPYWGRGYAPEGVAEVLRHGFEELGLELIRANRFGSNPASGRVLLKAGLRYLGTRPNYYEKWGEVEDRVEYALRVGDWREIASDR